ncbi:class I SAM-dependent methyltransferase [Achromobacter sp. NPDC008082]|uniref:class I SAM-dependent methyltransferase n=1 Tax=Achromobacter sp. NPDC008082 TaxID=3363888 RepID=UPI0036E6286A
MERLNFDKGTQYDGLEAAIHIARYSFAQPYCADKRVLDVACGEGYGSRLLADWGASEVVGVDISHDAVKAAQQHFGGQNVSFVQSEGETLLEKFQPESFDLIVSFETIEHVTDPVKFLENVKRLLKPGGVIAISCPNDWWYFPTEQEKNPYHLRKYLFEEFKSMTEGVLGAGKGWFLGGPMTGFLNLRHQQYPSDDGETGQLQMLNMVPMLAAQLVPSDNKAGPQPESASYFVGIWTEGELAGQGVSAGAAILPLSMDSFRTGIFQGHLPSVKEALEAQRAQHNTERAAERATLEHQARVLGLRVEALSLELQLTREQLADRVHRLAVAEQTQASMAWAAARYERLSGLVPAGMRRTLMSIYRRFWKGGRGN